MRWARLTAAVFLFWLILTISLGWQTVLLGLLLAGLVATLKLRVFLADADDDALNGRELLGLIGYALAMIPMVLPAAWQVAQVVIRPHLAIRPGVLYHRTPLTRPIARSALANSITITPGTHCVDLDDDLLIIHCLNPKFAEALDGGVLERRLARILERRE